MWEQLICHLAGDYLIQTDKMATRKTSSWGWALWHAFTYTLPFLLLIFLDPKISPAAFVIVMLTHALIDRYRLAKWVICMKNCFGDPANRQLYIDSPTGFHPKMPPELSTWLVILTDNTMHLIINYFALRLH